ncbi:MAG: hypothetical protein IJ817_00370 [Clostridia bacterium]|nr:hypothetical protein [Clostridia bacterium]
MKKIFLSLLIAASLASPAKTAFAITEHYAKVENNNVYFYSSPSDNSALFELPYSYFVLTGDKIGSFYKASYKDLSGYVKVGQIKLMDGTPRQPYAQATFKMFVSNFLYASPTNSSSVTASVETTDILTYYGIREGEQLNSSTNVWYYASLTKNGQTYYGYAFSGITDYLTSIPTNTENFNEITDASNEQPQTIRSLSTKTKIMLIVAISVPSAFILYFLIRPTKLLQVGVSKAQIKKKRKKVQHGDYFEYNENDL